MFPDALKIQTAMWAPDKILLAVIIGPICNKYFALTWDQSLYENSQTDICKSMKCKILWFIVT